MSRRIMVQVRAASWTDDPDRMVFHAMETGPYTNRKIKHETRLRLREEMARRFQSKTGYYPQEIRLISYGIDESEAS